MLRHLFEHLRSAWPFLLEGKKHGPMVGRGRGGFDKAQTNATVFVLERNQQKDSEAAAWSTLVGGCGIRFIQTFNLLDMSIGRIIGGGPKNGATLFL